MSDGDFGFLVVVRDTQESRADGQNQWRRAGDSVSVAVREVNTSHARRNSALCPEVEVTLGGVAGVT